ncbi:hypothetical protein U9M48_026402 [Paspalum notatum var. saurae]|uniref:Peroxidase n=1 Tax=Paspalum notatum var. saurae TaxID=547442 RepID=A0AAQ3TUI0_PASNO
MRRRFPPASIERGHQPPGTSYRYPHRQARQLQGFWQTHTHATAEHSKAKLRPAGVAVELSSMASLRMLRLLVAAVVLSAALMPPPSAVAQLRTDYYASVCPNLEAIVRNSVRQSMAQSQISAPATLRLFFHDCAVAGCDASIMIVNSNGDDEWRNSDNQSLKPEGFQTILSAKAAVDSDPQCRYKVSCADVMALAARESVLQVELGRYDGRVSTRVSVVLPHVNFTLDQLNAFFSGLGFSQTEMVALLGKRRLLITHLLVLCICIFNCNCKPDQVFCALHYANSMMDRSGAHTLGAADCPFFQYRIGSDQTMNPSFASQLQSTCSSSNGFAFLDPTQVTFDNAFYRNLQGGRGLLGTDQVLYSDQRSRGTVDNYATNQGAFFADFVAAVTKLGRIGVKTPATGGEIRRGKPPLGSSI